MSEKVSVGIAVVSVLAIAVFLFTALFFGAADALAQLEGNGRRGWAASSEYVRRYDANTVCTVCGKVLRVERFAPRHGMSRGVHLLVHTNEGSMVVHLGPAWFIDNQPESIRDGDSIKIVGSRITYRGELVLVAAKVRTDNGVLSLRETDGRPLWSGWRPIDDEVAVQAVPPARMGIETQGRSTEKVSLYKNDLDRHLWSWEDRRRLNGRNGRRREAGRRAGLRLCSSHR
jgi:hypothetical protein